MRPISSNSDVLRVAAAALALFFAGNTPARTQPANLPYNGGPVLMNPVRVFLVYWLPPGVVLDTSVSDGIGNFESLTQRFVQDLSGTDYLNIVTQYPGCGSYGCVLQNVKGAVVLGGAWTDTQAYPHNNAINATGTQGNPLQDSDIQNEVSRAISQNNWNVDVNSIVVVITGVFSGGANNGNPVEECNNSNNPGNCTFRGSASYCGYHQSFPNPSSSNPNTPPILYVYLSDASFNSIAGCNEGLTTGSPGANGQLASDREVVMLSHELFETITDPFVNVFGQAAWTGPGGEIGDLCFQQPAFVNLSFRPYDVQLQWSNIGSNGSSNTGSCVKNLKNQVANVAPAIHYLPSGLQPSPTPIKYLLENR
jgi:hypothetical protein